MHSRGRVLGRAARHSAGVLPLHRLPGGAAAFASREPLLPTRIVRHPRVKSALATLGNASYGALASGFLLTDILALRTLVAGGYCGVSLFHALQERPLRIPFAWSCLFACLNTWAALRLVCERVVWLSDEEEAIYAAHFGPDMTRPEFQKLMRRGRLGTATERRELIVCGEVADLVLLVEGRAEVSVGEGVVIQIRRPGLLGESSFLRGGIATKSVSATSGCRYVVWAREDLESLDTPLRRGLELTIGRELSRKLGETSGLLVAAASGARDAAGLLQAAEYEAAVLRLLARHLAAGAGGRAGCRPLFDDLGRHRRRGDISVELHTSVMEKLGIDEQSAVSQDLPLSAISASVCASHPKLE